MDRHSIFSRYGYYLTPGRVVTAAVTIIHSLAIATLFCLVPLLCVGCEPPSAPAVNSPPAPPPPTVSAETSTDATPAVDSVNRVEPFANNHGNTQPSAPSGQPSIQLSAGVALPQLLPDGTQIGVSVDYKVSGNLKSSRYVLVLESNAGAISEPVQLSSAGGTLQGFFPPSVRPEHQPFRARIDEISATGKSVPASNTLPLRTSY
jgi:hypothetical protein